MNGVFNALQPLLIFVRIIMIDVESSDDILNFVLASAKIVANCKSDLLEEPVVNYERQMVLHFNLLCHFVSATKSVSHDGDQHVKHMN